MVFTGLVSDDPPPVINILTGSEGPEGLYLRVIVVSPKSVAFPVVAIVTN